MQKEKSELVTFLGKICPTLKKPIRLLLLYLKTLESSSREKATGHQLKHLGLIDAAIGGKIQYCVLVQR